MIRVVYLKKIREIIKDRSFFYIITAAAVVLFAVLVITLVTAGARKTYSSYEIILSEKKEDSVSRYEYTPDGVVRYSTDGAALINNKLQAVWTLTCDMADPRIDVCRHYVLLYDRKGTSVYLCRGRNTLGSFHTELPIVTARVSGRGTVAAILQNGEKTELAYYEQSGTRIAAGESTITDPGYPVSLDVSEDGYGLAVSYLTVTDGTIGTRVRFCNFRSGGNDGNIIAGEASCSGIFAPDVRYIRGEECVLFRDNGFTVYRGIKSPTETKSVDFSGDVVSVFCEDSHIGFVFQSDKKEHRFYVKTYSLKGNLQSEMYIDHSFDRIHVCGDQIVFSDSTSFSVYSARGVCRYSGRLPEGNIHDVLGIGGGRLMVFTDQAAEVIRLVG